jgi:ATP-dependent DNA ligase
MPGAPSRWNAGKDMTWEAVRLERVLEVAFDGALHGRFRHATRFVRWRPDKLPHECTLEQLDVAPPPELTAMFGRGADQGSRRDDASDVSPS